MNGLTKRQKKFLSKNLYWLYYLWKISSQSYRTTKVGKKMIKQYKLKPLNIEKLGLQKSDTLFILGSGSSINQLNERNWNEIANNDSFGLNAWFIHDYTPTAYSYETPNNTEISSDFSRILMKRKEQYIKTPVILKDLTRVQPNLKSMPNLHYYVPWDIELPGQNEKQFKATLKQIRFLKNNNLLSKRILLKKRASISMIVMLAWRLNYKKVVLCGVDLNNTKYFYQESKEYYEKQGINIPRTGQTGKVHRTIDKSIGNLTIDKVLYSINDLLLKPDNIELFVALPSSALHPHLPSYFEGDSTTENL